MKDTTDVRCGMEPAAFAPAPAPGAVNGKRSNRRRVTGIECLEERCCPSAVDVWLGGAGVFSDSSKWNLGVVPNNSPTQTYNAEIPADSNVTLDINATIDNLALDARVP